MTTAGNGTSARAAISPADPAVFVGFGASGDLTRRKLVPALINLRRSGALPTAFAFVAVIRQADVGRTLAADVLTAASEFLDSPVTDEERQWFLDRIGVAVGDVEEPALYAEIATRVGELSKALLAKANLRLEGKASGTVKMRSPAAGEGQDRGATAEIDLQAPTMKVQGIPAQGEPNALILDGFDITP